MVGQTMVGIALAIGLLVLGLRLTRKPKEFLVGLGRPATEKHIRATRFLGALAFVFLIMLLVQWYRGLMTH